MKLKQTRVSSGNEVKHLPSCWCRTDVTTAAAALEEEQWTHSEPWRPMHRTLDSFVSTGRLSYPTLAPQRVKLQNSTDFLLWNRTVQQETVPVTSQCRCDQQLRQIFKEFHSLILALILSPPTGHHAVKYSLNWPHWSYSCCFLPGTAAGWPLHFQGSPFWSASHGSPASRASCAGAQG